MRGNGAERTGKPPVCAKRFGALLARVIDQGRAPGGQSWTNQRLANKLQMSDKTIRNWRNGKSSPVTR